MSAGNHIDLQHATAADTGIIFENNDGFSQALIDGMFLLAVPTDLDLSPGNMFCRQFYRSPLGNPAIDPYRGFRDKQGIYFDREEFQVEHVLTDANSRRKYFPPRLTNMVNRMTDIGLLVFRTTLTELGIPGPVWDHATNGAAHGLGTHWFVAHHYRGHREQLGCAPHKDTGFVTVPYTEQPGLEVFRDREWVLIDPVPGYFIVNFGRSFEILTGIYSIGTTAALHRVRRFTSEQSGTDRVSFAAFVDPPASGYLYRVNPEGTASPVIGIEEFLRANNKDTWDDEHTDFGIAPISGNGEPR